MHALGEVMQLLKRTLELGVAFVVGSVHAEHAHEHLLKHRGLTVCRRYVLAQVSRLDMEARKFGAVADDREIAAIDKLAVLRALDDANEVVFGQGADKRDLDAKHIGDSLDGMQLLLCLLGLRLERNVGQQAHLVGERRKVRGVFQALLDHVERHIASLLQVQNDLQAVNVLLGVLTIALRRAMRGDEPLIFEKSNF